MNVSTSIDEEACLAEYLHSVYKTALRRCNFSEDANPSQPISSLVMFELMTILQDETDELAKTLFDTIQTLLDLSPKGETKEFMDTEDLLGMLESSKLPLIVEGVSCCGKSTAISKVAKSKSLDLIAFRETEPSCYWLQGSYHNSLYAVNVMCEFTNEVKKGTILFDRGPISCLLYQGLSVCDGFHANPQVFANNFVNWWQQQLAQLKMIDTKFSHLANTVVVLNNNLTTAITNTKHRAAFNPMFEFELGFTLTHYTVNQFFMFLLYAVTFKHPLFLIN